MKIGNSMESMKLTKHLKTVLNSVYLSSQIARYCKLNVKVICALRNHSLQLNQLPLGDCWKLERFYRHNFLCGMDKSKTNQFTWHKILSKYILKLLHKICLCAWSMKPNASIWSDFKRLAKSYGKYYNYGMTNHPKVATVGYVKHILHLPYRYALKKPFIQTIVWNNNGQKEHIKALSWALLEYSRNQPEVTQLGTNQFSIMTPYEDGFNSHLHLELAFENDAWYLVTDVNPRVKAIERQDRQKLKPRQYHYLLQAVYQMCIKYQINHSANDIYFIEISDYSLQSAYYRLVHFELVRLALIRLLIKFGKIGKKSPDESQGR